MLAVPYLPGKVDARRLSDVSGLCVTKQHLPEGDAFHFARLSGCSCSLLQSNVDVHDATWQLEPDVLAGLARALKLLATQAQGMRFQAVWMGEEVNSEAPVPLKAPVP